MAEHESPQAPENIDTTLHLEPLDRVLVKARRGVLPRYPFPNMEVGEAFYTVPLEDEKVRQTIRSRLNSLRRYWEQRRPGSKWAVNLLANQRFRVQRVA